MLALDVLKRALTSTLSVRQNSAWPVAIAAAGDARVSDARMAEVVGAQSARRFHGRYPYPNAAMHQPDEKLSSICFSVNGSAIAWLTAMS